MAIPFSRVHLADGTPANSATGVPLFFDADGNCAECCEEPEPCPGDCPFAVGSSVIDTTESPYKGFVCIADVSGTTPPRYDSAHWQEVDPAFWGGDAWVSGSVYTADEWGRLTTGEANPVNGFYQAYRISDFSRAAFDITGLPGTPSYTPVHEADTGVMNDAWDGIFACTNLAYSYNTDVAKPMNRCQWHTAPAWSNDRVYGNITVAPNVGKGANSNWVFIARGCDADGLRIWFMVIQVICAGNQTIWYGEKAHADGTDALEGTYIRKASGTQVWPQGTFSTVTYTSNTDASTPTSLTIVPVTP